MVKQPRKLSAAQVEALDRDENGEAGGSKSRKLPPHEFDAICAEAYEAYDYQAERVRFDSIGRKWTFRPDKIGQGESVLSLEVRLLDSLRLEYISTGILASELGCDMVTDVVKAMAEAL
jgi:hypothetical protein